VCSRRKRKCSARRDVSFTYDTTLVAFTTTKVTSSSLSRTARRSIDVCSRADFFPPNQFTNTTRRRETSFDSGYTHTIDLPQKPLVFLYARPDRTRPRYNIVTICGDLCLRRENCKTRSGNRSSRSSDVKCNIAVTTVVSVRTDDTTRSERYNCARTVHNKLFRSYLVI